MQQKKTASLIVTQASLNQTAIDYPRNMRNNFDAVRIAVENGSDILALEELGITGYDCGDDFQQTDNGLIQTHLQDLADYAAELDSNLIISVGHPWRVALRDLPAEAGLGEDSERIKNPLFNRLDLPLNVQSIITHGQVQAMTAKMHLFNDERGYEKRYFQEWSMHAANQIGGTYGTITIPFGNRNIPLGRPIVHIKDDARDLRLNIAHIICEEKWVATQFGGAPYHDNDYDRDGVAPSISRYLGSKAGLVFIIPNASPPSPLKIEKHVHLDKLAARYANVVIDTDGLGSSGATFAQMGHRMVVQDNNILSASGRMSLHRVDSNSTTIRLNSAPADTQSKAHLVLAHDFKNATKEPAGIIAHIQDPAQGWDRADNPNRYHEEVVRMSALWLFDYVRKTKQQGIIEALSGGKDSSFNCAIVRAMIELAINELGVDGFCKEMGHLKYIDAIQQAAATGGSEAAIEACMKNFLTTVYMGTTNSSDETRNAARTLGNGICATHYERNVQDLLDFYAVGYAIEDTTKIPDGPYRDTLFKAIAAHLNQRPGTVSTAEILVQEAALKKQFPEIKQLVCAAHPAQTTAYENIQARARQVLIMKIANIENKLSIANPNLDEACNAYATFGGDLHSGTVVLNGFINKADEEDVMMHLYKTGLEGAVKPITALALALKNKPSAELQPKDENGKVTQNDEDALQRTFPEMKRLMLWMLHDRVLTDNGKRRLNAQEIFKEAKAHPLFKGIDESRIFNKVALTFKRWGIAQHKIHATPITPTFGLNVDHQTSLRTPNLSGQSRSDVVLLGVELVLQWAKNEGHLFKVDGNLLRKRALQDENFVDIFESNMRNRIGIPGQEFDLRGFYNRLKEKGWDSIFPPLASNDPLSVIRNRQIKLVLGGQ